MIRDCGSLQGFREVYGERTFMHTEGAVLLLGIAFGATVCSPPPTDKKFLERSHFLGQKFFTSHWKRKRLYILRERKAKCKSCGIPGELSFFTKRTALVRRALRSRLL